MFKAYLKNSNEQLSANVNLSEIQCRCNHDACRHVFIDDDVLKCFEAVRAEMGVPLKINSGFRCSERNFEVSGKPLSRHMAGLAVDIGCPPGYDFHKFTEFCKKHFAFTLPYPDLHFCHCDINSRTTQGE